jgi:hypothetical protein
MELHVDIFNKKENHLIGAFNLTKHFLQALVNISCQFSFELGEHVLHFSFSYIYFLGYF